VLTSDVELEAIEKVQTEFFAEEENKEVAPPSGTLISD
jgi:hypothetical protein